MLAVLQERYQQVKAIFLEMVPRIRILGASARNRKIIRMLIRDLRGVFGPYIGIYDSMPITIKVGHQFFQEGEEGWGAWHQQEDGRHMIGIRPNLQPGQLYTFCMHELGHAMGMAHGKGRIMCQIPRVGKTQRLTRKRRVEWVTDFARSVTLLRLK